MVNDLLLFVEYDMMFNMLNHKTWILISGVLWGVVGCLLLYKGLQLFSESVDVANSRDTSWLVCIALLVGFIKGRFVLSRTVRRISLRLATLPEPIRWMDAYPRSYWLLLASMMALGFLLRLVPLEVRAFIDVAVGSALLNGAMLYFRSARVVQQSHL
jgi:hypothetical protein